MGALQIILTCGLSANVKTPNRNLSVQTASVSPAASQAEMVRKTIWRQEREVWERLYSTPEAIESTGNTCM